MINNLLRPNIRNLKPYSSARSEFKGEGVTFLDANESPTQLEGLPNGINRYPASLQNQIVKEVSRIKVVEENQIFIGNGSDEAIDLLIRCFCEPGKDSILIFPPTYGMYSVCASINDIKIVECRLNSNFGIDIDSFQKICEIPSITFICNPNNPTGNTQSNEVIRQIIEKSKGIVVVDEAYIDFCSTKSVLPLINQYPNLVVCQTLSKAWGLAGARIGLAFACNEIIQVLNRVKFPYNIGKPSADLALHALKMEDLMRSRVANIVAERARIASELSKIEEVVKVHPSNANFLLIKVKNANRIYTELINKGIVVRNRTNELGCDNCLRITIGTNEENNGLIEAFKSL
jgi:histidinol-phosphate aminotransferase